ncbi:MAG: OmpP1/FadL family transporter [Candidatus Zixiibacteriota bacterium]
MNRVLISAIVSIALFAASVPATAQLTSYGSFEEISLLGSGARPRGMGGAFIGVAEGSEATYWNPAGLAYLKEGKATFGFLSNSSEVDRGLPNRYLPGNVVNYKLDNSSNVFNFVAMANPFRYSGIDLAVGICYQRVMDFNRKYDADLPSFERIYTNRDGAEALSFALAAKPIDYFSLGAALNVYFGGFEENTYVNDPPSWFVEGNDTIFMSYHENVKGKFSGANLKLAGLLNYRDFKLGFTIFTPFQLKEKFTVMSSNISDYYIPIFGKNEAGIIFNFDNKIEYPWMYGVGVSYRLADKLLLAADFETKLFSKSEITYPSGFFDPTSPHYLDPNAPDTTEDLEWENINQYRVGLEYLLETEFAQIPIRIGYRSDPKVYSDILDEVIDTSGTTLDFRKGDQVVGYVVSLGTGFYHKQYIVDFAYEFGSATRSRWGESQGIPFEIPFHTESKEKLSQFFISAGVKF